jgi:hypothetical protein
MGMALLLEAAPVSAQTNSGSPYSAFGFGDLFQSGTVASALMGGTGIAYTEPFSVLSANPATYASARQYDLGGLVRPTFEVGVRGMFMDRRNATASARSSDAGFSGFNIGIPFGRGKWGMAFGLNPFSDVGYALSQSSNAQGVAVTYDYLGSGGLNRIFAGLGRVLHQGKGDTLGDLGDRLTLGANFDFVFGGIEQTRKANYPVGQNYANTSAYSSLVLRAPGGSLGMQFSTQLISRASVDSVLVRRNKRLRARIDQWRLEHPGLTHPKADRQKRDAHPWRMTFGATFAPPLVFSATNTDLITTYYRNSSGVETTIDTLPSFGTVRGQLTFPLAYGFGISVNDQRWMATAEVRRRDWTGLKVDVDGFTLPAALRSSTTYAIGLRFTPARDGSVWHRTTYRAGLRYADDYLQVGGEALTSTTASIGASFPLNAAQTNSQLHIGMDYGRRGNVDLGLVREDLMDLWIGVSITPWKLERWFRPYQIQ